ncbi:MAG: hypothetical protein SNJ33_07555 [Rikenellaceae bacterium]
MESSKERMIEGVNKVIAQSLLSSNGVYLPSVGSIVVKLKPAKVSGSKKSVTPPMRGLDFSSSQEGSLSIIELIGQSAECSEEQATELYNSYLEAIRTEKGIAIDGVGTLVGKSFVIDKDFLSQLNPQSQSGDVAIQSKPKKKGDNLLFITLLAALIAGVVAYLLFNYYTKEEPVVETVEIVEPEPIPEPEPEPVVEVVKPTIYGVVYGVYSTPENVARSKGEIADIFGDKVNVTTHEYFTKTAVVIFESESKREAQDYLNTNYDIISDSWVYEIK